MGSRRSGMTPILYNHARVITPHFYIANWGLLQEYTLL